MTETEAIVVGSFDTLPAAANAVNALIAAGVEHGAIRLNVIEDEAGPAEGNFIIGNGVTVHGKQVGPIRADGDEPYDLNLRNPKDRSGQLVMVHARDEAQRGRIQQVLREAGGRLVEQREDEAQHH